jgi:rare lipoprotein A
MIRASLTFLLCLFSCTPKVVYTSRNHLMESKKEVGTIPAVQTGIASYYAEKFNGRRTSNGEIYDMHALTAAHQSLPFNSIVLVTNLENNKSVKLRINDRGPFVKDRIIDVSLAAANQLDMIGTGTAQVRIEVLRSEKK